MSLDRLREDILAKKAVVSTQLADQFISEPQTVEVIYNQHYHTHISLGDTSEFARRLIDRVVSARTPKGAIVAPWGYGKTSTLIFTWRMCEQAGILTVPPFVCTSLQDVLDATYGWLRFRLGQSYHAELQQAYQQYGQVAFDERVKAYAAETGVSEADAQVVLRKALEDGTFSPELTPTNLMRFLEYGMEMAQRAGYQGLVVLIDELQEFFDKSADLRGTIQKLRDVVWWLAAHGTLPLGIIFCLPASTESAIQQGGQDVLDRLKPDRLYISLRNIYSPKFPSQLWSRYIEHYEVGPDADHVLDRYVLEAIGQIATREDLGRGPRTVVDILQCAIRHYDKTGECYGPIALVDDFLNGQISFDMQTNLIRFAVEDAFSVLKNQITSEDHRKAIKLWAAFPEHGCPDEVLQAYGAKDAAYEISEMHGVHGPLLTYQSTGYTLRKLATFAPGGTVIERIARDFWLAYKEQDPTWAEEARTAFINSVLPRIFEKKSNAWGNWELEPTTAKGYGGRLTGTLTEQYPDRIIDVQVASESSRVEPRRPDARSDFQLDFVLSVGQGNYPGRIEYVAENQRWIRFHLNLGNRALAGTNLPQDLLNLKSSIHPNFLTPQLMLAFVNYVATWEKRSENHILENERGQVNAMTENMLNYAIRVLFSDDLKATFGHKLNFANYGIVREILTNACQLAWPSGTYYPLLTIGDRAFSDYLEALTKLTLREKRGDANLQEQQKGQLAQLFGLASHSTFQNRAKTNYSMLMEYKDRGGGQAEVRLKLHPLELAVLEEMSKQRTTYRLQERKVPAIELQRFVDLAHTRGYRDSEVAMVLKLLVGRELVHVDSNARMIYRVPAGPSPQEVQGQLGTLKAQIAALPADLVAMRDREPLEERLKLLMDRFVPSADEETLEEIAIDARRLADDLMALVFRKRQDLAEQVTKLAGELKAQIASLSRVPELEDDIPAGLDFWRHLFDLQTTLRGDRQKLLGELNKVLQDLTNLKGENESAQEIAHLVDWHKSLRQLTATYGQLGHQVQELNLRRQGLVGWLKLLRESDLLFRSLATMPDLRKCLTEELVREIMREFTLPGKRYSMLVDGVELFRPRFQEIERERDARIAAGNEGFGKVKQRLRQWLAAMGVQRPDVAARYSPVEHDQSYQDLYMRVRGLAESHLDELSKRLNSIDLDLHKARRIHWAKLNAKERETLEKLEACRNELKTELNTSAEWLARTDLAEATDLDQRAEVISKVGESIGSLDLDVRGLILRPVPPESMEERKVESLLASRRDMDVTELVLNAGDELDIDGIFAGLRGLYQGNQVTIKIQKRG